MKDLNEVWIVAERFGPFHGKNESDTAFRLRALDLGKRSTEHEPRRRLHFGVKKRDLIERDSQCLIRQIFVLYVNRDSEQADVAGLQLGQEIGCNDVSARAIPEKVQWQIEVHIHQAACVE